MYHDVVSFIHELYGTEGMVPLHVPTFRGNEKKYLNECIDTTFVSSVGKFVDRFEEMMVDYTGCPNVCIGTHALILLPVLLL
jgi:perosamine synthetase